MITFLDSNKNTLLDGDINALLTEIPTTLSQSGGVREFDFFLQATTKSYSVKIYIQDGTDTISQFALVYNSKEYALKEKIELSDMPESSLKHIKIKQTIPAKYVYDGLDFITISAEWEE